MTHLDVLLNIQIRQEQESLAVPLTAGMNVYSVLISFVLFPPSRRSKQSIRPPASVRKVQTEQSGTIERKQNTRLDE